MNSTIYLTRMHYTEPDHKVLNDMRETLKRTISADADAPEFDWKELVDSLVEFQFVDGGFPLLDDYRIPSDSRVDYCYEPTYICTALLIRAYLRDRNCLAGREGHVLKRAMKMCCVRELKGSGYDELQGLMTAVHYFVSCGTPEFLSEYPDLCPEFTAMFRSIGESFSGLAEKNGITAEFAGDIRKINEALQCRYLFVYGTLLKGQAGHDAFLRDESFVGNGTADGYDMYELGSFPGAVSGIGSVSGEVYQVTPGELKRIDRMEDEGLMYRRDLVRIRLDKSKEIRAYMYVCLRDVTGCNRLYGKYRRKW